MQEPAWVQLAQPNLNAALPDDQASGFYYLLADKQENLGTDQSYRRFTYKILNSSGVQDMSDLSINFDPAYQKVDIHNINIIRGGKIIDKFDPGKIQVVQRETNMERKLYDGRLTIIVNLTDIRADDIIDYSYTLAGSNPVYHGNYQEYFTLEFNIDAYQHRTSITVPEGEKFRYQQLYGAKDPEIDKTPEFTRFTWEDFELKAKQFENNTPSWYEDSPAVEITQFDSWEEVNDLFVNTFTLREIERHQLGNEVKKLLPNSENDKEFIENAIRFVQDEVRYLGFESGVNSHIPSGPSEVLQRRYGDCKDKSFLLSEILQSQGINAYPMLVHSYNGPNLTMRFPSPNAFDHCVVQIDMGSKGVKYIDPTISEQGGELEDISFPDYKYGLVLKPGTTGLTPLPEYETTSSTITETFELDDIGGGADLIVETIYRGDAADSRRIAFMGTSLQSIQKDFTSFYSSLYPGIKAEGQMSFQDNRERNEFKVFEKYRIDSLWTKTAGNRDVIQAQFYPLSMEDFLYPEKAADRKMPYFLNNSLDFVHKTVVYVPKAWNINNEKRSVKNDYFNWDLDIRYKNATLEITHRYKALKDHVAAEDVKQFLADHTKLQEDLHYFLTYNSRVAGAAEANSTSWTAVLFMLLLMAGVGILSYIIYKNYDLPTKVKAKHERKIGGWLILLGIGLFFTPFVFISQLLSGNYFSSSIWLSLFSSSDTITMGLLLGAELALHSVLLVFSLLVLVLFLKRRTIAPRMMIILYGSSFVFSALISFASFALHPEAFAGPERQDIYFELSKMGIRCVIFIPYLLYSTRVEETFTRTRKKDVEPEENIFPEEVPVAVMD
ncbi:DUF3857 domain-containing protein [Salinimicrobium flavum]|uniref:DUF3857 domain-containing protein n=1 Tax=Salinimicrobium flavum TaxID=1737065 RepID=A0ABW5IRZ3_9FLAO